MPYIADGMAHLLCYHEHIATVHTEHGKHHVHFEVEKENKKNSTENNSEEIKKITPVSEHILHNPEYVFYSPILNKAYFPNNPSFFFGTLLQNDSPPPRC
jgi:hypothetical protein